MSDTIRKDNSTKIVGNRYDLQKCPFCEGDLKSGKPFFRWVCPSCKKYFAISEGGLGNKIIEVNSG